jgi:hypothetical protein
LGALGAARQFDPVKDLLGGKPDFIQSHQQIGIPSSNGQGYMIYKGKTVFTVLAALLLVLVVVDVVWSFLNQLLRVEVTERQQFISQSIQLDGLHREIVSALANIALKTNDEQLTSLLASQGINLKPESGQAGGNTK